MAYTIERCEKLKSGDLADLCSATESAIRDGIGFNWSSPPQHETLEKYWKGVLVIPERTLFLGRLDGVVASAVQLVRPGQHKETTAFAVSVQSHFVAPWARGHGMAKALLSAAEDLARAEGYLALRLSVRATQEAAISLYQAHGYHCWGVLEKDERIGNAFITGHYFTKDL
jgi:ribosomal protein S18 acetylase RimI-like enzyme